MLETQDGPDPLIQGVLVDDQVLILSEFYGKHLVSVAAEIGTSWPLHATSTGKVLLAPLPEERRLQLLKPPLRAFTPSTITDLEQLNEQLERALSRGYATAVEELEVGAAAVAVALQDPLGNVVGAMSIGGPTSRLGQRRLGAIGKELTTVAERLSDLWTAGELEALRSVQEVFQLEDVRNVQVVTCAACLKEPRLHVQPATIRPV